MSDLPQPTLPRLIILQQPEGNHKYLRFDKTNPSLGSLRFLRDYSRGLETRLEVVPSQREGPVQENYGHRHRNQLVHIRSLYNNKFWKKTRNSGTDWITATAETTDENPDSPDCTVFQVEFVDQYNPYYQNCILLRPEKSEYYLADLESKDGKPMYSDLQVHTGSGVGMYKFIDWESIVTLPERIRIKGDNGKYLRAYPNDAYLGFDPNMDNSDAFDFAVSATRDGGIRLKNIQYGGYWRADAKSWWVFADGDSSTDTPADTVFIPVELGGNKIGLRCLESNTFCKRYTSDEKANCLAAYRTYLDETSYLEIEEPVIKRTINNVHYIFDEARRYDETPFAVVTDTLSNGSDRPQTSEISMSHTVKNSTHWTNSNTVKVGVEASFEAKIRLVGETDFKISGEYSHSWDKGEVKDEQVVVETKKTITVPPKTTMQAIVKGTRLSFEIPYTYTQHDILKNGHPKVSEKKDGLFKATNGYGYDTEIVTTPYSHSWDKGEVIKNLAEH